MSCYVYCLYSTEDGEPRYVGRSSDKVSYRFNQHVTAALEKEPGALYDWIRDAWRRGYDVCAYILQEGIIPKDLDLFEKYWISQFSNLLNVVGNTPAVIDSQVAKQVKAALRLQVHEARKQR
jgi:hypothetical protein